MRFDAERTDSPGLLRLWRYLHLRRNLAVRLGKPVREFTADAFLLRQVTAELIRRGLL